MEFASLQIDLSHIGIWNPLSDRILPTIKAAFDRQSLGGGCVGNQLHNGLIVLEGFASPIRRDE